jgi:hypothetical protein
VQQLSRWESNGESRTLLLARLDLYIAIKHSDRLLDYRKSKTSTLGDRIFLRKRIKNRMANKVRSYALPSVRARDTNGIIRDVQ